MMGATGIDSITAPTTSPGLRSTTSGAIRSKRPGETVRRAVNGYGGALAAPSTAYMYDWNTLPIGQLMWEKELMSYEEFPPLQTAASYNLSVILQKVREMAAQHPSQ